MSKVYKNTIFTHHAYDRSSQRNIDPEAVWQVINQPHQKVAADEDKIKYIKKIKGRTYHVVAQYKADQQKHLVISVWVRGEDDQLPIAWQLITLPFKLVWWLLRKSVSLLFQKRRKS